jgi:hypothetical protein
MEKIQRRFAGYSGLGQRLGNLPWWAYGMIIPGVYLLGWVLHWIGVIPGK